MTLLLILALASNRAAASPASETAAPQIEKLTQDGKADDAIAQGRQEVAAHPEDVDLRLALARALSATARHANRVINAPLTKDDVARGSTTLTGVDFNAIPVRIDYDPGLLEEALLHLDAALERAPKREDVHVFQCFLLTDANRIGRAKLAIEDALRALPNTAALAKTMTAYGAERAKRGDAAGGAALLAPVAKAFPDNPAILIDYANVLTRLGKKREADAAFDRAITLSPKEPRYARTKAVGAMLLRDYPRAQSAFDAAFQSGHDLADAFAGYAAAYGIDPAKGASLMRDLAAPAASSDPALTELAAAFARTSKKGPGSDDAMTLARTLMRSEQYVFAIPVLDRLIQVDAKNVEAKSMLREAYKGLGCESLAKR